jgi:hypothetical protein
MPAEDELRTLEDLLSAGAHRTLEYVATHGTLDVSTAADYLSRRYGNRLQPDAGVLPVLVGRVQDAIRAGQLTNVLESPLETEIPAVPGYPAGYSYTVIGEISDPLRPADERKSVTFPIRIHSPTLLTFDQLQAAAEQALQQIEQQPDNQITISINSPPGIQNTAAEIRRQNREGVSYPVVSVLSVYKGV